MITQAIIAPHPPIIIPEIGKNNLVQVKKTIKALQILSYRLETDPPDLILIISPHGPVAVDVMTCLKSPAYTGDFGQFGFPNLVFEFPGETDFVNELESDCQKEKIPLRVVDSIKTLKLDHGSLVPLYYLTKNMITMPKIMPLSFSFLSLDYHYQFGQIIAKIAKKYRKIAIIASGDLSHRLTPEAPAGFSPQGKVFDEFLVKCLAEKQTEQLLALDSAIIDEAGECGLRSFVILLGILSQTEYQTEILSYEGPFGVGYLVANFIINPHV